MRHTFSADEVALSTHEGAVGVLAAHCTRTQSLSLRRAIDLHFELPPRASIYPNALHVAAQLKYMHADVATLIAAILGTDTAGVAYPEDFLRENFGQEIARLTTEVRWLNKLSVGTSAQIAARVGRDQAEVLRRMVLTMVNDIRVVLVKLAFRTQRLYALARTDWPGREEIARETMTIYAPLANRLGLGQLKWELEDMAYRIVEPEAYKHIACSLEENRAARESYIRDFVNALTERIKPAGVTSASVFGRPKHIYSIARKMQKKRVEFAELFDVRAVRVLVDDVQQCYAVLGIVHSSWQPIGREFDDYIANPKDNGYRSLHTAVIGPAGKPVEVQIRTRTMDDHAENGVAAHWAYKEGGAIDEKLQHSISLFRQLLEDNADDEQLIEGFSQQVDVRRVYAFTPKGEVIDLVAGSTPLDFAYHVHSEIGHRCRGAKINGSIVPLTYLLQNGDRVEVLTTREPAPSREWLNRSLGYLNSGRARSKVRAWFNTQDQAQNQSDGRAILERELKRLKASAVSAEQIAERLKYRSLTELYTAIGRNDVSVRQVAGVVDHLVEPAVRPVPDPVSRPKPRGAQTALAPDAVRVRGVGKLLTQIAVCCKPVPYDDIVGYITKGKGVTIHRADCSNILSLREFERERLISVDWGDDQSKRYEVEIQIIAYDRQGLLRDVSAVMSNHDVDVIGVNTRSNSEDQTADMKIDLKISTMSELADLMEQIRQLRNVQEVERVL